MGHTFKDDDELFEALKRMATTLVTLRHWTKEWETYYGSQRKDLKKKWEKKADELIVELELIPKLSPKEEELSNENTV